MPKKIIVFDLDNTLIDTSRLKKDLFTLAEKSGLSERRIRGAYKQVRLFSVAKFSRKLFPVSRTKQQLFGKRVGKLLLMPKRYNYPGAARFVQRVRRKHSLFLLSQGDREFQIKKLHQSSLSKLFDRVIITSQPSKATALRALRAQYGDRLTLLDNSLSVVQAGRQIGIKTIKIKSGKKDAVYYGKVFKLLAAPV